MTYIAVTILALLIVGILVADYVYAVVDKARSEAYSVGYDDGYNDCLWMGSYGEVSDAPDDGLSDDELEEFVWRSVE